jgi:hypothetical protein
MLLNDSAQASEFGSDLSALIQRFFGRLASG